MAAKTTAMRLEHRSVSKLLPPVNTLRRTTVTSIAITCREIRRSYFGVFAKKCFGNLRQQKNNLTVVYIFISCRTQIKLRAGNAFAFVLLLCCLCFPNGGAPLSYIYKEV